MLGMPDRLVSKLHIKSCLNYLHSENNGSRCRCASRPLFTDWLAVSLINQKGSICAAIMFSVSFLIAGCRLMVGGAVRRYLAVLMLPELCNC